MKSKYYFTLFLLTFSVLFQGLIVSITKYLFPSVSFSVGVILSYMIYPFVIYYHLKELPFKVNGLRFLFVNVIVLLIIALIGKSFIQNEQIQMSSLFRIINYTFPLLFFVFVCNVCDKSKIIKYIDVFITITICYSLLQTTLHPYLPDAFISPPLVAGVSAHGTVYIDDSLFYKPNGLIGNPLEFATFLVLSLLFKLFIYKKDSNKLLFNVILINFSNFLLFSRISLVIIFLITFYYVVFLARNKSRIIMLLLVVLIFALVPSDVYISSITFFLDRFLGDASTGSNEAHIDGFNYVISLLAHNPIVGVGINSTIVDQSLITDGFWWKVALEFGLPLFVLFFFLLFLLPCLLAFSKLDMREYSIMILLVISVFVICLVNSSLFNKCNYMLFWFLYGVVYFCPERNGINTRC
ncbi:hypothetical protein R7Q40_21025 [Vibrio sp. 506]|uniref:hypothetical protein n=1 Tax=Vibrio sp. 506 TaxID=3074607 RepID=UPI00296563F4|nr:hypothetical protein [Vibrio sp. 506]MDW2056806.1 hypothetical protein [Vibrio sp. 506]